MNRRHIRAFVMLTSLAAFNACDTTGANKTDAADTSPSVMTSRVADITGRPDDFVGDTVTIEADVEEVLAPFAFTLDEDAPLTGGIDNDLLVFSPKAASLSDIDDQWLNNKVKVTGVVRRMSVIEIEREIGWDLDPKIEVELERVRPVVIATSIERTGRS